MGNSQSAGLTGFWPLQKDKALTVSVHPIKGGKGDNVLVQSFSITVKEIFHD